VAWWWGSGSATAHHGQVDRLSELPPYTRGARVQAWSPANDTVFIRATLPTRARAKILQALPFALEEQILGDPETQSYSYRPEANGSLAVAVTARARLQAWSGALEAAGYTPSWICSATLKVPYSEGHWSLDAAGAEGALRTGPLSGMPCSLTPGGAVPMTLSLALREARDAGKTPQGLLVYNPPDDVDAEAWSLALDLPVAVRHEDFWAVPANTPPLNLLEREYAARGADGLALSKLRPAAILLGLALLVSLGFNLFDWWKLSRAQQAQRSEMVDLFRRSFPEAKTVVDPAVQMERNVASLRASSGGLAAGDLLPLLASTAQAMQASPQAHLRGLQYADTTLTLDVSVPDFQAMEAMKNTLSSRGLHADVLSANSREGAVDGHVRIKAGGTP
jgi:general secretion pathway protein L